MIRSRYASSAGHVRFAAWMRDRPVDPRVRQMGRGTPISRPMAFSEAGRSIPFLVVRAMAAIQLLPAEMVDVSGYASRPHHAGGLTDERSPEGGSVHPRGRVRRSALSMVDRYAFIDCKNR